MIEVFEQTCNVTRRFGLMIRVVFGDVDDVFLFLFAFFGCSNHFFDAFINVKEVLFFVIFILN